MTDQPTGFAPDAPEPARRGGKAGPRRDDWRPADADKGGGRAKPVVLTLFALLAVGGALVGIFARVKPQDDPQFVTVPVGEYKNPAWPVNPWANRDADRLAGCFPPRDGKPLAATAFESQEGDRFRQLLAWVAGRPGDRPASLPADPAARPLVLHVTALAVAWTDGKVYLLPGDARPADPATWVPVDEVLDAVKECRAKNKFLLLDLAHPVADPFGGVFADDAAAKLHDRLDARQKDGSLPYPVLTSCGPGELSLPADAETCSAFALYLADGLAGAADGYNDAAPDGQVSARELARFTAARVSRWARKTHDRPQTPRLYGPAGDFPVVYQYPPRAGAADRPAPEPYPDWLARGWQARDQARAAGADRGVPAALARLTADLDRAERAWLRSGDAGRAEREWAAAKSRWDEALAGSGGPDPAAERDSRAVAAAGRVRLAAARRGRPDPPADWGTALDQYLAAKAADPPKPDDVTKYREAWQQKAKENPADAAWVVWRRAAAAAEPTRRQVAAWSQAYQELGLPRATAEGVLLQVLDRRNFLRDQGLAEYPSAAVAALLTAEDELGAAVAAGPDGFAFVRTALDAADRDRRGAEKAVFDAETVGATKRAAGTLTAAAGGFKAAGATLRAWQAADRAAVAVTTAVVDTWPAAVDYNRPAMEDWLAASAVAAGLADELAAADREASFRPAAVADAVRAAEQAARKLRAPSDPAAVAKFLKEGGPRTRPADLTPLEAWVAGPALPGDVRKAVWDALRADRAALHDAARKLDAEEDDRRTRTPDPAAAAGADREAGLAARRAGVSRGLLRLAGLPDPPAAADEAREAWLAGLPARAATAEAAGRADEVARIARATPPAAAAYQPRPAAVTAAAAAGGPARDRAYLAWLSAQRAGDKPVRGTAPDWKTYDATPIERDPD